MVDPIAQLETNLGELLAEHDALLALLERKHQAIRHAKPAVVEECLERENGRLQRIGELEKHRQQLVAELTERFAPQATEPMTLAQVADLVGDDQRERLLGMLGVLRERMEQVRHRTYVIAQASQGLLRHVHGVVQRVTGAVTGAGTYGRSGRLYSTTIASSSFAATA